jgi:Ca2+-binding RTX toxin-like protein
MADITGTSGNDTLLGTPDNDRIDALEGNDTIFGFGGNDTIFGRAGVDTVGFNVSSDGADTVDLGADNDFVAVGAAASSQIRLTFTSAEVGNNNANDSNSQANQDGGLAVRLRAEDNSAPWPGRRAGSMTRA